MPEGSISGNTVAENTENGILVGNSNFNGAISANAVSRNANSGIEVSRETGLGRKIRGSISGNMIDGRFEGTTPPDPVLTCPFSPSGSNPDSDPTITVESFGILLSDGTVEADIHGNTVTGNAADGISLNGK